MNNVYMPGVWSRNDLSCADSSLSMPHPRWILQKYTTFGESDTQPLSFLKSPSNIGNDLHPLRFLILFDVNCSQTSIINKQLQQACLNP
ncbi:hypothetical protein H5410_059376 [Solanum commersonii]|uniref:Uncharacterized protein n=1 Tax=Solanum commersonii TaxID=4109 RepID=A0A9J5W2D0_SOLCO|nr:hypothetical protein H5410_059376 [Solanum commersonii]